MTLSNRQIQILSILRQSNTPVSSTALSQKTGVSKRTIISDIQDINSEKKIILACRDGYLINGSEDNDVAVLLSGQTSETDKMIIKTLLSSRTPVQVQKLMDDLNISSTSLQKSICSINSQFEDCNIQIVRTKKEVRLEGNEINKRELMGILIHRESDEFFSDIENLNDYFPGVDACEALKLINQVLKKSGYRVKEYYTVNFLINVLVILNRSPYHKGLRDEIPDLPDSYEETKIAGDLIYSIEKNIQIVYDDYPSTVHELSRIMYGFIEKETKTTVVSTIHLMPEGFVDSIRTILQETFDSYHLNINYESFLNVFAIHVYELIRRCNGSIDFVPSSVSIQQSDPFVYDVAVFIAGKLHEQFSINLPESEINLIAVHIGYAIEQSDNFSDKPTIAIISNNYHGIADRIIDQIQQIYGQQFQIAGVWENISDIPFNTASNAFIISTSRISQAPFSICYISPFLTLNDQKIISERLTAYLRIVKNREFSRLFYLYSSHDCFIIRHQKMTKKEVIHELADIAVKNGDVNEDFEKHVLLRERYSSTAFYNKFAIPHSDKQEAKRTRLYIMVNSAGIAWDDQTIHIVFLIAIDHRASIEFRRLYNSIIETLYRNDSILANINKIQSISDFIRYFSLTND